MVKKVEKILTKTQVIKLGLDKVSVITADMLDGYTSIGDCAFSGCRGLTSVTIPNSVTSIGIWAFNNCRSLTSITIPNSITSIGSYAFEWCDSLTYIEIPNSVASIGEMAFYLCRGLTSVSISNSVTSIGNYAFANCDSLTSVSISNSVTSIGVSAFNGCISLTSIIVENGNSFYDSRNNCNAIIETATNTLIVGCKNTIIPNSVTIIGESAFNGCSGLTSVTIPNSVTSIGRYAFNYCSGLASINIPDSVTSIGESAFRGCSGLTSVTIPNSVTSIGSAAFEHCSGLTSVTIGNKEYKTKKVGGGKCKAYKAFNVDMTCRDFQYKEGETYELDDEPILCQEGFHACLSLVDVFNYYYGKLGKDIVVHEVKLEGVSYEKHEDSKVVAKKITIGKRIL